MGGPGEPPAGTPEGAPGGGEDEYRSVVFDESFVRAARLQEYSARERITDHAPAVRRRPPLHRALPRQALMLVLLIAVAFATAVYMGVRHPYRAPEAATVDPLRMTVIPLAPRSAVPGSTDPETLFAHSPAARFRVGAKGITLPAAAPRTAHFSEGQVMAALNIAKEYVVASSMDPVVLAGGAVSPVRLLLDPRQFDQFDQSFEHPAADGEHAPTGWLIRFDPRARLADRGIRVQGTLRATESGPDALQVTADHTLVYALKPTGSDATARVSLFTLRRTLTFRFDHGDLRMHQTVLAVSSVQAGPLACAENNTDRLHPLLAGQKAGTAGPAGTDPYTTISATALCGTLSPAAQPRVPGTP
ncbi:SCO2583 family membrane protein [Streptomyces nodosus]|uniref:SCO2583 family membrane protein n=1 Tax=Streptomyces nodosus TaxID=40318 RepID=UPI0037F9F4A8